jgi:transportin-1
VLDLDEDDYQKEDKATDIKPHIHKSRTAGATTKVPSLAARMGMTADDLAALQNGNDEEDVDDEEEEEDEEDDDTLWTVRRAASRSLETAADIFEAALLEIFLPEVTKMLSQQDLFQREAAIHALGSVAAGKPFPLANCYASAS